MRSPIKTSLAMMVCLLGAAHMVEAQATPAGTVSNPTYNPGPNLPLIDGNFQYAISAAEILQFGYFGNSGVTPTTSLSGDVEYLSQSTVHPFSMLYAGGVLFSSIQNQRTSTFQTFTVSQGLVTRKWSMGIADSVSYLPQSPTTGLAGVPGVGDQGLQPQPDPGVPAQSVLTNYGRRVSNSVSGNISRQLDARTSLNGGASYAGLYFLDGVGIETRQVTGQLGLNRLIDARSSVGLTAQYSTYSYSVTSFNVRGLSVSYNRQLSRELSLQGSVGPQWTSSFLSVPLTGSTEGAVAVPGRLSLSATLGLMYTKRYTSYYARYGRGVNSGSGLQAGAVADSISAGVSRSFGRDWSASATGNYTRTSGLSDQGITSTIYAGTQVSRRITSSLSAYASYSAQHQSLSQALTGTNAFNGLIQSVGFGITFSPRMNRLGQF